MKPSNVIPRERSDGSYNDHHARQALVTQGIRILEHLAQGWNASGDVWMNT